MSEQHEIEARLRESERKYRDLVKYAPAGILEIDYKIPRFLAVNDAICEISGYSREELLTMDPFDLLDDQGRTILQARINQVLNGAKPEKNVDYLLKTKDGREIWASLIVSFTYDVQGFPAAANIICHDVTERKLAEIALQESEEKYRLLVENANEGIVLGDTDGKITFVNQQMADMLGYTRQELMGRIGLDFLDQDQADLVHNSRKVLSGDTKINQEYKFKRRDGFVLWTLCNACPLFDPGGKHIGNLAMHKDITMRKEAENQLKENERKYRELVKYAPVGIFERDLGNQRFISVNNEMSEITGYSREELMTMSYRDLFDGESKSIFRQRFSQLLNGEKPYGRVDYRLNAKDGQVRYVSLNAILTKNQNGQPVRATGIVHDITERKKAEAELIRLQHREELLSSVKSRLLFSTDPESIIKELCTETMQHLACDVFFNYIADRDMGLLHLNAWAGISEEAARKLEWLENGALICGCAAQQGRRIVMENISTTLDPRADMARSCGIQAYACHPLLAGEQVIGTLAFGSRSKPHFLADELSLMETVADHIAIAMYRLFVNKQIQRNEQRLECIVEERTAKLASLNQSMIKTIESISDAFFTLDREWVVTYWNEAAEKLFNLSRQDILGRYGWDVFPLPGNSEFRSQFNYAINKQLPVSFVTKGVCINRWVAVRAYPSRVGLTVYMQDITKEKELEIELTRLDRLNLIGEMAASIGHEIRNPMTSVRGFLQLLGSKNEYQSDGPCFELMIEEIDRANTIITEYLAMAKNKQIDLQLKSIDYLVTALYPILMSDANLRGLNIHLDLGNPPEISVDEREMRQFILNMARNGMEAMPEKGTLTIGTMLEEEKVVLYVKDEGPGLAPEIELQLGTPFVTTKDNGTGLGLPVCYSIALRHKAKIDYETGPTGTTFNIRFPLPLQ